MSTEEAVHGVCHHDCPDRCGWTVTVDPSGPQRQLPPLMRGYLAMGGKVADHAVTDPALDTLHVFTGVEVAAIPPARARLLRAIATP